MDTRHKEQQRKIDEIEAAIDTPKAILVIEPKGRWRHRRNKGKVGICILATIEPEGIKAVAEQEKDEVITLYVDSGATETVIPDGCLRSISMREGEASRRGVRYETANGIRIPNLGEK